MRIFLSGRDVEIEQIEDARLDKVFGTEGRLLVKRMIHQWQVVHGLLIIRL